MRSVTLTTIAIAVLAFAFHDASASPVNSIKEVAGSRQGLNSFSKRQGFGAGGAGSTGSADGQADAALSGDADGQADVTVSDNAYAPFGDLSGITYSAVVDVPVTIIGTIDDATVPLQPFSPQTQHGLVALDFFLESVGLGDGNIRLTPLGTDLFSTLGTVGTYTMLFDGNIG
ncbi:hypothetical protein K501DRAFT_272008 [Backusella circina FSU 941]|nr:hypothetical protein K501DRAFT_272008 [Backusella circina FSU 941]